ncbi:MAG TPA: ABC transporter permease [Candidatus Saccharimonadales bacterium]|nr:ABC transporter permease [Candidatus Saccharimonadales bacterium]
MPAGAHTVANPTPPRSAHAASGLASAVAPPARPAGRVASPWLAVRGDLPRGATLALFALSFVLLFLAWWWLSSRPWINPVFVPSPARVWTAARDFLSDGNLWLDVKVSLWRVTAGFLLSAAVAIPIGVWMGSFRVCQALLQPLIEYVRYIPVPALIPLLMLFFGIEETAKIMLIFVGVFFQLVLMVADEVRRVPHELVQVSQTLGATRGEIVRLVLFRAALPGIFDALRLCNGWAWTYLVVAELIAANEGMGYRILKFSRFLQTPKIFVYLILLGCIGLALDAAFRRFNARVFHWANATKR